MALGLMSARPAPDAIVCANNLLALGCVAALEELGLGVPAMNRVFSRVRAMGVDIDPAVYTVEQAKAAFLAAWRKRKEGK